MDDVDVETFDHEDEFEEVVDVEDPLATRRQELKELRANLVSIRRQVKSADKKQKKSLQANVIALEESIQVKKEALEADEKQAAGAALVMERTHESERLAAARAKRQAKKEAKVEEEAQRKAEAEAIASQMPQLNRLEREAFEKVLGIDQLDIFDIAPDGNCLFNAIVHQLYVRHGRMYDQKELRRIASNHILENEEKYVEFLEEPAEEYCERVRESELWGGHLELDAICSALQIPIIVYQANSDPMTFGSEYQTTPLRICFQRYAYSLGEHYDSLVDSKDESD